MPGEIPKRLKGSVLKTDRGRKLRGGSNPSFSATYGSVAQLVEHRTENPGVAGSTPAWTTIFI